ncbi:methylenetetrahydrofolate reductase [Amycolatopsis acidicola]|uniref:Methylenetetrahydrofolate reductase n=1 Tax=Amycolatopsis acidicola TaxID=2596893 RepID=A0A5N0VLR5_9PSEU|nr:methylenetetrahydrofolate reductase [Amycolatopsis acidicola]KAA9166130.1 methylenetetrahydrofolate reductase [Amycolatopsis acidicola]
MPQDTALAAATALLGDFSLEMTGKDIANLTAARALIPAGTRVNVTYLGTEDLAMRLAAVKAVQDYGFVPVAHISARRLRSPAELEEFLAALQSTGASENVFVVGGDPTRPEGPYEDSLAVLRSGLLQRYGVRHVSVSGYPEGHPGIGDPVLWSAIEDKNAVLRAQGLAGTVITQFGFDSDAVLAYVDEVRKRGIGLPIRVGVPGPAGIKRLLSYARRFGVGTSTGIAKKYGFSITNLLGTAGPDRFLTALAEGYEPHRHGEIKLHFYTFGGLEATSGWIADFRARN